MIKFKKKSAATLFDFVDSAPTILVAMKYNGECSMLHSNDPEIQKNVSALTPHGSPYYVCHVFSIEKSARAYEDQLRALDLSPFIPKDHKEVKADR